MNSCSPLLVETSVYAMQLSAHTQVSHDIGFVTIPIPFGFAKICHVAAEVVYGKG